MKKHAVLLSLLAALNSMPLHSAPETRGNAIWQIGTVDRSSNEFNTSTGGAPKGVPFVIGKNDPLTDWAAAQTIASNTPREIQFTVPKVSAPAYSLKVALLIENASMPALKVTINGHAGYFHLHPVLDYEMGDPVGGNRPAYSHYDLAIDFPADYLKAGDNSILLQPVSTSPQSVPDAAINYDAVELDRADAAFDPRKITAQILPTVFYQKAGTGLTEQVEVFVRYGAKPEKGTVALEVGGRHDEQPLPNDYEFGESRATFSVPEFTGEVPAKAIVTINGQAQSFDAKISPKKKWTVYVVPMVHLDVGYTDYQSKVYAAHSRDLDEALDFISAHPDFRYSMDASMDLDMFMRSRSPDAQQRLITAMQNRQIFAPAQYCNQLTGFPTAETLIRSLYCSANFSREHHTPFEYANLTDAPSPSWALASILASSGVNYFLSGTNNDRGPILMKGHLHEQSPFWWEGTDGQKILFWYARCYRQVQMLFGLPTLVDAGHETLPVFLQIYETPTYHASSTLLYGSQGENRDLYPQQAELAKKWNDIYAFPHLEYAGFKDAVAAIAAECGDSIPTFRGDGGPYWEDGIAANPFHAAMARSNEMRGVSAEKLQTLSSLINPRLAPDKEALDEMWWNMVLYDEHTQVTSNLMPEHDTEKTIEQLFVKNSYAIRAHELALSLLQSGMGNLAESIAAPNGSIIVYNTLNWNRDGFVTVDLSKGDEIADSQGQTVPVQTLSVGRNFRRVLFTARDIPGLGYKVFSYRHSAKRAEDVAAQGTLALEDFVALDAGAKKSDAKKKPMTIDTTTTVLESPFYKIKLDPASGALSSVYDKQLQKELVDTKSPYRFGQYVYVTGGDGGGDKKLNGLLQYRKVKPELQLHLAQKGRIVGVRKTPYGWSARLESSTESTPKVETEIRLFEKQKKIELIEDVTKNEVYHREGVYFAFPFAMSHPQFQYEIQNGVIDPEKDMLPGAGREWFTVQHWVSVQQDGMSGTIMPLDSSLVTLGDINRGVWPFDFGPRPGTIFAFVLNNYHQPRALTDFNVPEQLDHLQFRYVITSDASTKPVELSRMGWEEMTPLEKNEIEFNDKVWIRPQGLDAKQGSFLNVSDPALVLTAWKTAEDGSGTILRFLDLGGAARTVTVETPLITITSAQLTDAVERNVKPLAPSGPHQFQIDVKPHGIVTVRLNTTPVPLPANPAATAK